MGSLVGGPVGAVLGAGLGYGLGSMTSSFGGQMLQSGANTVGNALSSAWDWTKNAATTAWNATAYFFTNTVPDFFVNTVWKDWIVDKTWNKFMVGTIWNKGLVPAWNWVKANKDAITKTLWTIDGVLLVASLICTIVPGAQVAAIPLWIATAVVWGLTGIVTWLA